MNYSVSSFTKIQQDSKQLSQKKAITTEIFNHIRPRSLLVECETVEKLIILLRLFR